MALNSLDVFTAKEPSLGYLYQIRYSLYKLIEAQEEEEISIEWVDDIAMEEDGSLNEQLQLKHHLSRKASLTNKCADLWKTIRIWSEGIRCKAIDPLRTKLLLVTTAAAPEGTIASLLRDDLRTRNVKKALSDLMDAANSSGNKNLKDSFDVFLSLPSHQKQLLVNSIVVVDGAPIITDLEGATKKDLNLSVRKEHLNLLYERLEGWWFNKIIRHFIEQSKLPIKRYELVSKIRDIAEQFEEGALPIDYANAEPPEKIDVDNDNRIFVLQLKIIALSNRLIEKAIRDYYRAFEQRSRWARENLLKDEDLENYEKRLIDEWERYFLSIARIDSDKSIPDVIHQKTGQRIFKWMNLEAHIPIRPKVIEPYVMRGSYHMLADREPPVIGWHPQFIERLKEILVPVKEQ